MRFFNDPHPDLFWILMSTLLAPPGHHEAGVDPIRLQPENPRWFEWRDKGTALVASRTLRRIVHPRKVLSGAQTSS